MLMRPAFVISFAVVLLGCSASRPLQPDIAFPSIPIASDSTFRSIQSVGIAVIPSDRPHFDRLFANLIGFDLLTRGYVPHDLEGALPASEFDEALRLIGNEPRAWGLDAVVMGHLTLRTADDNPELLRAVGQVAVTRHRSGEVVASVRSADGMEMFIDRTGRIAREPSRFMLQRMLDRMLAPLPVRPGSGAPTVDIDVPVVVFVDDQFRLRFWSDWRERVEQRIATVNDIFIPQSGIGFRVTDIRAWNTATLRDLRSRLFDLVDQKGSTPAVALGIALQPPERTVLARRIGGMASYEACTGIVTPAPSPRGFEAWNARDDALVMAHELGHLLGLPHLRDRRSIMFPDNADMSSTIDPVSRALARSLARELFDGPDRQRSERRLRALDALWTGGEGERVEIIQPVLADIDNLWRIDNGLVRFDTSWTIDTADARRYLDAFVTAPEVRQGVLAVVDMYHQRWQTALERLGHALVLRPDFTEALWWTIAPHAALGDRVAASMAVERIVEMDGEWFGEEDER